MLAIHSILVPTDLTDASAQTVDVATSVAGRFGSRVHLLHVASVIEPIPGSEQNSVGIFPLMSSPSAIVCEATDRVDRFIRRHCGPSGDRLTAVIVAGGVVPEILAYALSHAIDLIVMGACARGPVRRFIYGSISESILKRSPCPVLLVPHRAG